MIITKNKEKENEKNVELNFKGLFKVEDVKGNIKYQAIFVGYQNELSPFIHEENEQQDFPLSQAALDSVIAKSRLY